MYFSTAYFCRVLYVDHAIYNVNIYIFRLLISIFFSHAYTHCADFASIFTLIYLDEILFCLEIYSHFLWVKICWISA